MKIISGGQRGVDLGAVKAARRCGVSTGGFVPLEGKTERGNLSAREMKAFAFCEVASYDYRERTRLNIGMADALILISDNHRSAGTVLTRKLGMDRGIPIYELHSSHHLPVERMIEWIELARPDVLMIAGNRESVSPGIEERVETAFMGVFGGQDLRGDEIAGTESVLDLQECNTGDDSD